MDISWHSEFAKSWRDRVAHKRLPHAVLLVGPAGVGKRPAAAWITRQRLGIGAEAALPIYPFERPEHPDLRWITPPEDKQAIGIEQIRERGGAPFIEYQLPEAVLKFKQGFGRLIRSRRDRGIVVILDGRVLSKPYGRRFLEVLPECPVIVEKQGQAE